MGKALRLLNLQKISAIIPGLMTIMIVAIAAAPYSTLSTPKSRDRTHISFLRHQLKPLSNMQGKRILIST
jgi:hypothetical protein